MNKEKLLADAENKIALGNEGVCYILEDLIDSYTEELKNKIEGKKKPWTQANSKGYIEFNQALDDIITELNHK